MQRVIDKLPLFRRIANQDKRIDHLSDVLYKFLEYHKEQMILEGQNRYKVNTSIQNMISHIEGLIVPPDKVNLDLDPDLDM